MTANLLVENDIVRPAWILILLVMLVMAKWLLDLLATSFTVSADRVSSQLRSFKVTTANNYREQVFKFMLLLPSLS